MPRDFADVQRVASFLPSVHQSFSVRYADPAHLEEHDHASSVFGLCSVFSKVSAADELSLLCAIASIFLLLERKRIVGTDNRFPSVFFCHCF
jgi:hypothetical protein